MTIKEWVHNLTKPKTANKLTDDHREIALSQRRIAHSLRQKEKEVELLERISKIEHLTNPKTTSMDKIVEQVLPLLITKLANERNITPPISEQQDLNNNVPLQSKYSDEQIDLLIQSNPQLIKHAEKVSDEDIKTWLIEQDKTIQAETIDKIILKVRYGN